LDTTGAAKAGIAANNTAPSPANVNTLRERGRGQGLMEGIGFSWVDRASGPRVWSALNRNSVPRRRERGRGTGATGAKGDGEKSA
jgi:hypothetical protein